MSRNCAFISTVTNKKPAHVSLTKVKQFQGSSSFAKRSQWTLDQLRQVNGIDPNKVMSLLIPFAAQRCFGVNLSASVWVFSPRTVQSSTWCLKTRLTSGALVHLGRSAPSSRFSTTPASATAQHGSQSSSTASPNCWGVRWLLHFNPAWWHVTTDQNVVFLQGHRTFWGVTISRFQARWCICCRTYLWYVFGSLFVWINVSGK